MSYKNKFIQIDGEITLLPTIAVILFFIFLLTWSFSIGKIILIILLWKFDFGITVNLNNFIKTKHNQKSDNKNKDEK